MVGFFFSLAGTDGMCFGQIADKEKKDAVVSRSFIRMLCHTICSRIEKVGGRGGMIDTCKREEESCGGQESCLEN